MAKPVPAPAARVLRIAAVSDIHYGRDDRAGDYRELLRQMAEAADVLLLCGDLTDYGRPEEAEALVDDVRAVGSGKPVLAVLGNHDFESGDPAPMVEVLAAGGVQVLDGGYAVVEGVGFAGVRGFGGGFGRWALAPWGEPAIKAFVQEAVQEGLKLDAALGRLQAEHRVETLVALMHYAPVCETVVGEPEEIFPFMGSSRLEDPLNRYAVACAFHGHAHAGSPEGKTTLGIPVYNVALPVLRRAYPDRPSFRLVEVPAGATEEEAVEAVHAAGTNSR